MSTGMTDSNSRALTEWDLIEPLCIAFEEAWRRGARPLLDDYLRLEPDLPQQLLLEELLRIELFYRQSAGETVDAEQYKARFVEAEAIVDNVFAAQPHLPQRTDFSPKSLVGRYQIMHRLGHGSFGIVYLSHDQELDRDVAIKIPGDGQSATPEQMIRLLEEARAAARLRHPGIVAVYDVQPLADGGVFAVLEYVAGQPLSECQGEPVSAIDSAKRFALIADAVAYAHNCGFVHRDLHPGNILIDERGAPHVADFGLAIHEDQQRARAGERAGSLFYMAPEQVRGETHRLDGRADIWAIGAMLYEALTGRRPFAGETTQQVSDEILNREPKPLRQIRSDIPADLEQICFKCLAKKPEDRFATAGDLANALRATVGRRKKFKLRMAAVMSMGVLAIAVATACVLIWHFRANHSQVDLNLLIWKVDRWRNITEPGVVPLRSGDQLRIEAQASKPRYIYLLWLDAAQQPMPIYPWSMGEWHERTVEKSRLNISLPTGGPNDVWRMQVPQSGHEMILLLTRPTPLPKNVDLEALLRDLPPISDLQILDGARMDYQHCMPLSDSRDLLVASSERILDPLLLLQRELKERLEPLFPEMECLVIPVAR